MTDAPILPRWYVVSKDGLLTTCVNERDARKSAAEYDRDWPMQAPHRAVLLGDVAADRARIVAALKRRHEEEMHRHNLYAFMAREIEEGKL